MKLILCLRKALMCQNKEWLIEFKDNSFFRISENQFYKKNQRNNEVCVNNERGMREMDFCYCHQNHIDLIECKKPTNPAKQSLKENCIDKALHSSALLKTALYSKNNYIIQALNNININYTGNEELKLYFIFKIPEKDKSVIYDVAKIIENDIKKFLICPLGKMWNIKEVQVLDYETAKDKLNYIK